MKYNKEFKFREKQNGTKKKIKLNNIKTIYTFPWPTSKPNLLFERFYL